jgi:hypothetical protein
MAVKGTGGATGATSRHPHPQMDSLRYILTTIEKFQGRAFMRITAVFTGIVLACALAWGQAISTSQINGTVRDASGLAVAGAEVKATQTATGLVRTSTSGADGSFLLTDLPVGPYQLEAGKEGFAKYVQSGIVLQVGSNPTIEISLKIGSVTEQVVVEAGASLVETRNAGVGTVMENQRVLELPLNGRQATDLIYLSGMATQVNGAGLNSGVRNFPRRTFPSPAACRMA